MPISRCPCCDQDFGPDDGLFILPVEPYSAGMLFGDDARRGREDQHHRTGRWHSYETMYAQRIVADFEAGTMPLSEGTKLGNFLCNILNCSPSRLSKKLKIGKKYFQRCQTRPMGEEDFAKHREAQKRLSDLEEMFLAARAKPTAESPTPNSSANASRSNGGSASSVTPTPSTRSLRTPGIGTPIVRRRTCPPAPSARYASCWSPSPLTSRSWR
ncbi:unnamed protein product [Ascophyllum nodosum]